MAKQIGAVKVTGRCDNLCFYRMGEEYYVRTKSSLGGKRVKKDPAFSRTMEFARRLGSASKIASCIYRELPDEEREHSLFRMLTGKAMQMLRAGKSEDEIAEVLRKSLNAEVQIAERNKISLKINSYAGSVIRKVFIEVGVKVEVQAKVEVKDKVEVRSPDFLAGILELQFDSKQSIRSEEGCKAEAGLMQTGSYEMEPP